MDELYFGRSDEDLYLMHVGRSKEDGAPGRGAMRKLRSLERKALLTRKYLNTLG